MRSRLLWTLCSILMEAGPLTEPSNHEEVLALYLTSRNTTLRHLGIYKLEFQTLAS